MAQEERDESYLTVAEVAELLKLNQQTVRNWIDSGSMPAIRIGRRVRIRKSDLDRVLASGYQGPSGLGQPVPDGPSATDFWGGEAVGTAELDSSTDDEPTQTATTGEDDQSIRPATGNGQA